MARIYTIIQLAKNNDRKIAKYECDVITLHNQWKYVQIKIDSTIKNLAVKKTIHINIYNTAIQKYHRKYEIMNKCELTMNSM